MAKPRLPRYLPVQSSERDTPVEANPTLAVGPPLGAAAGQLHLQVLGAGVGAGHLRGAVWTGGDPLRDGALPLPNQARRRALRTYLHHTS